MSDVLTPEQRAFVEEVRTQAGDLAADFAHCKVRGQVTNYGKKLPLGTEEVVKEIARKCGVSLS